MITPRPARRNNQLPVPPALAAAHKADRRAHSAKRIRVEHGNNHLTNWRAMSYRLGRRNHLDTMLRAVAGLLCSQERPHNGTSCTAPPKALPASTAE